MHSRVLYTFTNLSCDENTLAHLGKQSVSLDITTLQRKPLSNQSFGYGKLNLFTMLLAEPRLESRVFCSGIPDVNEFNKD